MQADNRSAFIAIEISHPDPGIRELIFEQFKELKAVFNSSIEEEWDWQLHTTDQNHKTISRIIKTLPNVSIFNQNDWPALISFFKPRIIALDDFWSTANYSFGIFK